MASISNLEKKKLIVTQVLNWYRSMTPETIGPYIRNGRINQSVLSIELGFARSAFGSNKRLRKALKGIESRLRGDGLIQSSIDVDSRTEKIRDVSALQRQKDKARISSLEAQNAELRAQLEELRAQAKKNDLFESFLAETGRIPRP